MFVSVLLPLVLAGLFFTSIFGWISFALLIALLVAISLFRTIRENPKPALCVIAGATWLYGTMYLLQFYGAPYGVMFAISSLPLWAFWIWIVGTVCVRRWAWLPDPSKP
jgi:hypothetical protein